MPSQDNENAMDGLLRRSLARDSTAASDCPDAELLAAYFDQSLGSDEAAGYEFHFSTCARCREQLAAMARASTDQILQPDLALEPALAGARPAQVVALEAAPTPDQTPPHPQRVPKQSSLIANRPTPDGSISAGSFQWQQCSFSAPSCSCASPRVKKPSVSIIRWQ